MATYDFYCIIHEARARCVDIKPECTTIYCSDAKNEHKNEIPTCVIEKVKDTSVETAMLNNFMPACRGLELLRELWSEMPDDFPFTLKIQI